MILFVGSMVTFFSIVVVWFFDQGRRSDLHAVERRALCERICEPKGGWLQIYRQQIGFGSREWRCVCYDGTWQPVP